MKILKPILITTGAITLLGAACIAAAKAAALLNVTSDIFFDDIEPNADKDNQTKNKNNSFVPKYFDVVIKKNIGKEEAAQLAESIVSVYSDNRDNIYSTGAEALISALILRIAYDHDIDEHSKTIAKISEILEKNNEKEIAALFPDSLAEDETLKPALDCYRVFEKISPELHSNILTHAGHSVKVWLLAQ